MCFLYAFWFDERESYGVAFIRSKLVGCYHLSDNVVTI